MRCGSHARHGLYRKIRGARPSKSMAYSESRAKVLRAERCIASKRALQKYARAWRWPPTDGGRLARRGDRSHSCNWRQRDKGALPSRVAVLPGTAKAPLFERT